MQAPGYVVSLAGILAELLRLLEPLAPKLRLNL